MTSITHIVTDSGRQNAYAMGDSYEQAVRNLNSTYSPSDFGCDSWDAVVAAWEASEDGRGDMLVVLASDHPRLLAK